MSETAAVLISRADVDTIKPGLYVVHSGSAAYFPALALLEAGQAHFEGETYDKKGRAVTLRVGGAARYAREGESPPQMRSIRIGAEFFVTALKDYNNWPLKWWREAIQNAVDAGATEIDLTAVENADGTWTVACSDNGRGMDEDTIINKFLVLGATTKTGPSGAAGGFGKAKELLLLPWISWKVHSRDTVVSGAGIDYHAVRGAARPGTRLEVVMPADKHTDGAIGLAFINKCYLPGVKFTVNGEPARANLYAADVIDRVPDKADIYFVPADHKQSYLYVRARGLFMFESYIGEIPGFLIAELTAPSIDLLTANRDGFRDYNVRHAVDRLAERIAKDNMSALKSKRGLIRKKFKGSGKFKARERAAAVFEQIGPVARGKLSGTVTEEIVAVVDEYTRETEARNEAERIVSMPPRAVATEMLDMKFDGPDHLESAIKQLVWQPDFFLINDIEGFVVPKKFHPETMTPTILKLAKVWAELCRYVFIQLGSDVNYGIGFYFSEDAAAAAITDEDEEGRTEKWVVLNPFKDVNKRDEVWRPAEGADLKWLYAAAIHECTHIADRLSYHDESFAAALTRNMAKCADGYRKIKQIVSGIRMRGGPELE